MDKSEGKDWVAKTLNNVTEETAKIYKLSRTKLEISSLTKVRNEKMNILSRKLFDMLKNEQIDATPFEAEFKAILAVDEKLENYEKEVDELKSNITNPFNKKDKKKEESCDADIEDITKNK